MVERPTGGLSVVLADGQTSGRGAKAVSQLVVRKVIGLLAEGVRDGAAARAASDALFADKAGKVTCTLNIASVDLHSKTIVLTRNNPAPVFICRGEQIDSHNEESISLGTSRNVRPVITELGIETDLTVVIFTDGISHAGKRRGQPMNVGETIRSLIEDQDPTPQQLADSLLAHAISLDDNRPADDISVLVLKVSRAHRRRCKTNDRQASHQWLKNINTVPAHGNTAGSIFGLPCAIRPFCWASSVPR